MAAKRAKPKRTSKPTASRGRLTIIGVAIKAVLAIAIVAATLTAVIWLGEQAGEEVTPADRYAVKFTDLVCNAPPDVDRLAFLSEVRFLGQLPETLSSVDPNLPTILSQAFARHPWVERVAAVTVTPERVVNVNLQFRTPTLAIRASGETDWRIVDRHAVLLPLNTTEKQLPVLQAIVAPPRTPPGQVWADPLIQRAVELATTHHSRNLTRIEKTDRGWRLVPARGPALLVGW